MSPAWKPVLVGTVAWSVLSVLSAVQAADAPSKNVMTVVIADGPLAGSYQADPACLHVKARNTLGAGFKAFAKNPKVKTLEEAGIQADKAEGAGAKTGDIVVKLFDGSSDKLVDYSVKDVSITLTHAGQGGQLSFAGKTPGGIHLKVSATCVEVEEF